MLCFHSLGGESLSILDLESRILKYERRVKNLNYWFRHITEPKQSNSKHIKKQPILID